MNNFLNLKFQMKSLKFLTLILLASVLLTACGKSNKTDVAVLDFFEQLEHQEIEALEALVTPESKPILTTIQAEIIKYKSHIKPTKVKYEILERNLEKEKGSYKIKIIIDEKEVISNIPLVFVNNVWLIHCTTEIITDVRFVVFFASYEVIINQLNVNIHHPVRYTKKKTKKRTKKHTKKRTKKKTKKRK